MTRPPSAPKLPLVGNALAFNEDPLAFLRKVRQQEGDVVDVDLGPLPVTLVSHPDVVEDILVTRSRLFQKDRFLRTTLRPVLGDGLLSSDGDFWRRQRRLMQPAFHRDRIRGYGRIMVRHAERLAATWRDGETRDVHKDMMKLTLEIVSEALFGTEVEGDADAVAEALDAILDVVSDTVTLFFPLLGKLPTPRKRRFDRAVQTLDRIIYGIVEARRRDPKPHDDLLAMLLAAEDEDGSKMTDRQLRDECLTLFLAGHETTAIALSWTFVLLGQNRAAERTLHDELDGHFRSRAPATEDYGTPALDVASRVITESLRMYPPAWSMGREAKEDVELGGWSIARGDQIWFCPWSIHRDPRWFEAPDAFRPERWTADFTKSLPRYAYFPFGGGPRLCIGQGFALTEAVLVLATLARSFRVELDPSHPLVPETSVTLRPKFGVKARVVRR